MVRVLPTSSLSFPSTSNIQHHRSLSIYFRPFTHSRFLNLKGQGSLSTATGFHSLYQSGRSCYFRAAATVHPSLVLRLPDLSAHHDNRQRKGAPIGRISTRRSFVVFTTDRQSHQREARAAQVVAPSCLLRDSMDYHELQRHPLQQMDPAHAQFPLSHHSHDLAFGFRHTHDPDSGSDNQLTRRSQEGEDDGKDILASNCADWYLLQLVPHLRKRHVSVP